MWDVSDEALLAGYATGDPEAAVVFVRRFQTKVFGLARSITRDTTDAEEVAQDAFLRAWRYAASYDARRGAVTGWLLGITRNVALDRVRLADRRPVLLTAEMPVELDGDPSADEAGDAVGRRDDVARVAVSMRALPDEQRAALVAVTLLGLTTREYAEAAGVPLGTAKTRVRLGLRKLRDRLGADVGRSP